MFWNWISGSFIHSFIYFYSDESWDEDEDDDEDEDEDEDDDDLKKLLKQFVRLVMLVV